MTGKFKDKYRIASTRLQGYDYGADGMYFVTICVKNRRHSFGEIVATGDCTLPVESSNCATLQATRIGKIANDFWLEIPKHYPFVDLDAHIIMPDHMHGILLFSKPDKTDWTPNQFGVQSQNLGAVIRAYKSSVKRYANENNIDFIWQAPYHDRIIRDEHELINIRNYILNNPLNWLKDQTMKRSF